MNHAILSQISEGQNRQKNDEIPPKTTLKNEIYHIFVIYFGTLVYQNNKLHQLAGDLHEIF